MSRLEEQLTRIVKFSSVLREEDKENEDRDLVEINKALDKAVDEQIDETVDKILRKK